MGYNNNEQSLEEMYIERLLEIFHRAERKGLIHTDNKFIDVTDELEVYRNLTPNGLYFTVKVGPITCNYEKGDTNWEFESLQAVTNFSMSDFLDDFNKEVEHANYEL